MPYLSPDPECATPLECAMSHCAGRCPSAQRNREPLDLTADMRVPPPPEPSSIGKPPPSPAASPTPPARAAYTHREARIVSAPAGGWALIVQGELVAVSETHEGIGRVVSSWARGDY